MSKETEKPKTTEEKPKPRPTPIAIRLETFSAKLPSEKKNKKDG